MPEKSENAKDGGRQEGMVIKMKRKRTGSLKRRILLLLITFAVLLDIVSIAMAYRKFVTAKEQFSSSTASTVAVDRL